MMNSSEISEVRNYLLSKNLSLALLVEIEDHFIMQIEDAMLSDKVDFARAFKQTKESWSSELKMVRRNRIGKLITSLENKLVSKNTLKLFVQSFYIGLLATLFLYLLAINFSFEVFDNIVVYQYPLGAVIFALYFLIHIKHVLLGAKQRNIRVSILSEGGIFNIFFPYLMMYFNIHFSNASEEYYHLLNTLNFKAIGLLFWILLLSISVSFGTLRFINFIKSIKNNYSLIKNYDSL